MKAHSHSALFVLALAAAALLSPASAYAQQTSGNAPLQIGDISRETQAGTGTGRYVPPVPAKPNLPTLWLIGDSTVRNGSPGWSGPDGQWGWGAPISAYFDPSKINVVNRALGGTSSRSFYKDLWPAVKALIKKGDFVIIQFGANDGGSLAKNKKASLPGIGDDTAEAVVDEAAGTKETAHSFGWYLKQFVDETRAQGGAPIICSMTPRKSWSPDGKFGRGGGHAEWAEQVAKATNTPFVPLNEIIGRKYDELGKEKVEPLYKDNIHTSWDGAVLNAECVIAGIKALPGDPLGKFLAKRAQAIAAWKH